MKSKKQPSVSVVWVTDMLAGVLRIYLFTMKNHQERDLMLPVIIVREQKFKISAGGNPTICTASQKDRIVEVKKVIKEVWANLDSYSNTVFFECISE